MALSPEAREALDPSTTPERLRDIARRHPALQVLVVTNPSCADATREDILRTNAAAAEVYGASHGESADGAPIGSGNDTGSAADGTVDVAATSDEDDLDATRMISVDDHRTWNPQDVVADDAWTSVPSPRSPRSPLSPGAPSDGDDAQTRPLEPVLPAADDEDGLARTAPVPPAVEEDTGPPPALLPRVTGYLDALPVPGNADHGGATPGHGTMANGAYGHGAPGYGAPGYGSPSYGGPAHASPSYGSPTHASPSYGSPASGPPSQGSPAYGAPTYGSPAAGSPSVGAPSAYPAAAGAPGYPGSPQGAPSHASPSFAPGTRTGHGSHPLGAITTPGTGVAGGPDPRRRFVLIGALACFGLAALLVILVVLGVTLSGGNGTPDASSSASSTTAPSESTAEAAPSPSAEAATTPPPSISAAPAPVLVAPAPAGAPDLTSIQSPSHNITCELAEGVVGCSVLERSYGPQDCPDPAQPFSAAVAGEGAGPACGQVFGTPGTGSGTVLEYGSVAQHGEMACRSESGGMSCWNQRTGKGFTVSRSTYTTF